MLPEKYSNKSIIRGGNMPGISDICMYDDLVCSECGNNNVDRRMHKAFGVNICYSCKKSISLISQTIAIEEYLLTASDLRTLPHMEVPNPMEILWKPMRLYRREEVEALSREKHPSIPQEKERRKAVQKERKHKRIQKKIDSLKRITKKRTETEERHRHSFDSEGKCQCGMQVEQEEI
ncbi:DNA-repair protein complementing XP-A cells [Nematocida sp. LUAm3]|nr:DNA-repair protein complementing XP-A cells [Nematocida sp. LUAm3]KAI5176129.1 DNA-repair protein complementing XP-A cells [Nematocida sp. LUAm2]KAI5179017.1 DNA-repair protein complementing XP-A cells [Nematocida sp. LUAm1]